MHRTKHFNVISLSLLALKCTASKNSDDVYSRDPNILEPPVCGDYYRLVGKEEGYMYNPEYPDAGEVYDKACTDVVQVRDGDKKAALLGEMCDEAKKAVFQSSGQWLWVMLKTDNFINPFNTKFFATFYAFPEFNTTVIEEFESQKDKPEPKKRAECRSYEFECRNKECISMSYRCDHFNDCGCTVDCDESGCEGILMSKENQFYVGIGLGIFIFTSVGLMTCLIEGQSNWIASRVEELRIRENQAEERRKKAFKAFTKFIGEKEV